MCPFAATSDSIARKRPRLMHGTGKSGCCGPQPPGQENSKVATSAVMAADRRLRGNFETSVPLSRSAAISQADAVTWPEYYVRHGCFSVVRTCVVPHSTILHL